MYKNFPDIDFYQIVPLITKKIHNRQMQHTCANITQHHMKEPISIINKNNIK